MGERERGFVSPNGRLGCKMQQKKEITVMGEGRGNYGGEIYREGWFHLKACWVDKNAKRL